MLFEPFLRLLFFLSLHQQNISGLFWNSQVKIWGHQSDSVNTSGGFLPHWENNMRILQESTWSCSCETVTGKLEPQMELKAEETDQVWRWEVKSMKPSDKRESNNPFQCCCRLATNWRRTWWRDQLYKPGWSLVPNPSDDGKIMYVTPLTPERVRVSVRVSLPP